MLRTLQGALLVVLALQTSALEPVPLSAQHALHSRDGVRDAQNYGPCTAIGSRLHSSRSLAPWFTTVYATRLP